MHLRSTQGGLAILFRQMEKALRRRTQTDQKTNCKGRGMLTRILVVDDEPDLELMITQKFRKQIHEKEFEFAFAHNGVAALQVLQANPAFDVVLTDINMPEMDGLTLLAKINEAYPLLKTVIVSAYGDMKNIRTALNHGAFDFVTKPIEFQDLEITLKKSIAEAQNLKQAAQERDRLVALQRELEVAATIQKSIVPQIFPPFPERRDFTLHAQMIPAREVGGDFYDFFFIYDHRLGFVIGDVSGKGVPAALFMAVSKTLLKATALKCGAPHECLQQVNRILWLESVDEMFVTAFYGILDVATGEIACCNGGHNRPFITRRDGRVEVLSGNEGLMLGLVEHWEYHSSQITLAPGDSLILYTDGVTEAMDHDQNQFTEDRLAECLQGANRAALPEMINSVVSCVRAFAGGAPQADDLTVLALRYKP